MFDLLKEIYFKDMEELDKNEGKKKKLKKIILCLIFGWLFYGRNYRMKLVWYFWILDFKRIYY